MQLAIVTPLATQRDRVSMLAPLEHAPETTSSSAAPTSTHSDEGEWTSRTSARTDRRFRAHCGGELLIWFGAPIRHFCSVTGVNQLPAPAEAWSGPQLSRYSD